MGPEKDVSWHLQELGTLALLCPTHRFPFCTSRPLKADMSRPSLRHAGVHLSLDGGANKNPIQLLLRQAVDERGCIQEDGASWACSHLCPLMSKRLPFPSAPVTSTIWLLVSQASCRPSDLVVQVTHTQFQTPVSHTLLDMLFRVQILISIFSQQLWLLASLNKLLVGTSDISRSFISQGPWPYGAKARGDPCCLPELPSL